MEQKEFSKLRNNETIKIKPADKGGTAMMMKHLFNENSYEKPDSGINNKE